MTRRLEILLVSAFTCTIFYGDLYFGFTIPAALLLLPLIVATRAAAGQHPGDGRWSLPVGLVFLALVFGSIAVQMFQGYGPRGRSDLTVYLPLAYGAVTIAALAGVRLSDRRLHRTLVAGGVLAGLVLIGTLLLAPAGTYAVPGQDPTVALRRHDEVRALLMAEPGPAPASAASKTSADPPAQAVPQPPAQPAPATSAPPAASPPAPLPEPPAPRVAADVATPEPEVTGAVKVYYRLKNMARTPLGMSNFLAVMFVFLFNVMLYQRSRWAALFGGLVLLTVSRSGVAFLLLSVVVWLAHRRGRLRMLAWVCGAGAILAAGATVLFWEQITSLPGAESLGARAWYVSNAFAPISTHPMFGAPRSESMRLFGYPITWTPHTSILHLWVLFGLCGTVAYLAYIGTAIGAFARRAPRSDLWRGITAAVGITLVWSTIELIVLTPPFEILVAACYAVARGPVAQES